MKLETIFLNIGLLSKVKDVYKALLTYIFSCKIAKTENFEQLVKVISR